MSAPPRSSHLIGLYLCSLRCKTCSFVPKTVWSIAVASAQADEVVQYA